MPLTAVLAFHSPAFRAPVAKRAAPCRGRPRVCATSRTGSARQQGGVLCFRMVCDHSYIFCLGFRDSCRYTRVGSVVVLLHDPSDVSLEGAKPASCAGADGAQGLGCRVSRVLRRPRRYTRVGSVVMLLHDPSDVFLEGAKLADYAGADGAAAALFVGLAASWAVLRLGLLPLWVIRSCMCAPAPPPCRAAHAPDRAFGTARALSCQASSAVPACLGPERRALTAFPLTFCICAQFASRHHYHA